MTEKPETPVSHLATALAAFQAALPSVHKGASGQVQGRKDYKYADLADINGVVLPLLGKHGLSFSAKPTLNAAGRFVLAYTLRHSSGEQDTGEYPLPEDVTPQQMGSAQTYARRYAIQAMTGVAPDEDDDGRGVSAAYNHGRQAAQGPAQDPAVEPAPADRERTAIADMAKVNGWTIAAVSAEYGRRYDGEDIRTTQNVNRLRAFSKLLPDAMTPATNGATQ